jgi:hypothetical protein
VKANIPAAASITISKISEYLEEEPEIIDFYLWRFFKDWGDVALLSLIKFVSKCEREDLVPLIKPTLIHDFSLQKSLTEKPKTSEG